MQLEPYVFDMTSRSAPRLTIVFACHDGKRGLGFRHVMSQSTGGGGHSVIKKQGEGETVQCGRVMTDTLHHFTEVVQPKTGIAD